MDNTIIVALISGACVAIPSVIATLVSNKNNNNLIQYRIEELSERVNKHNNVIERTYILEEHVREIAEDIKELKAYHR